MGREASQVLSPPQLSCESSVIANAHRIRDEFFNTIGQRPSMVDRCCFFFLAQSHQQ
jgi:hypothetical protein